MIPRKAQPRAAIDLTTAVEQGRLFSAVSDLARAGAQEPLEDALGRIDEVARELGETGGYESRSRLLEIKGACDRLADSLSSEQRRVMKDLAELQGRILQRRRFAGAPADAPAFDRRG